MGAISGGLGNPAGGSNVYGYLGFLLTLGILPVYVLTNLATARYFLRAGRFHLIRHGVLPLGGAALMVALLIGQIIEQTTRPYTWFPWVIVIWVVLVDGGRVLAGGDPPAPVRQRRRAARRHRWRSRWAVVIGVDVGSQSVKAVVADEEGTALATASAPCTMSHPAGGWAEQDPEHWRRALALAVRQACAKAGVQPRRRHDARPRLPGRRAGRARRRTCKPLRPAIIWLDRRATTQSDALRDAVGEADAGRPHRPEPRRSATSPRRRCGCATTSPSTTTRARWLAPGRRAHERRG